MSNVKTDRRSLLAKASSAVSAVAAAAATDTPEVVAQPKVQWRMSTTWPPAPDVLQGAAQCLTQIVEETSGGRFRIELSPSSQIVPPLECLDAASRGTIEAFMASTVHWPTKDPALPWFSTVPLARTTSSSQGHDSSAYSPFPDF